MTDSGLSGFYKKGLEDRLKTLKNNSNLNNKDINTLRQEYSENIDDGENVIGSYSIPLKLVTNLRLKTSFDEKPKDYLVPMVTPGESSIVAAQSKANKLTREGKIETHTGDKYNIRKGQIILKSNEPGEVKEWIEGYKGQIINGLRRIDESMVKRGGGAEGLEAIVKGDKIRINIYFNTQQAMGALNVTENCEKIGSYLESKINEDWGGVESKVLTGIVSNSLENYSLVEGEARLPKDKINEMYGEGAAENVLELSDAAEKFSDRATTYNKGIANAVTSIAVATGNDTRAIEAALHGYAQDEEGQEEPLITWEDWGEYILGKFKMPIPVGTVGGKTGSKMARISYKLLGINRGEDGSARKLAEIMAACGVMECFGSQASMKEGISKAFH